MKKRISLNRNTIKYIAAAAMAVDHAAMCFVPEGLAVYYIMRFIGRVTAPVMCMFLAEGYYYTSSKKKYALRLIVFALASQPAYALAHGFSILTPDFNMIFTLFLCFMILYANERIKNIFLRAAAVILLTAASYFCDWGIIAPAWVLTFYFFRDSKNRRIIAFGVISAVYIAYKTFIGGIFGLVDLGLALFVPLICLYDGQSGKKNAFSKWFFYIFYPLHLALFGLFGLISGA